MTALRLLRAHDYRRMAWKNGGGITTEIARSAGDDEFDWRISIAEIAQDGDFSIFPGVDRELMLLDGGGVELLIGSDAPVALTQRYQKHAFPGEAPVSCRLLDGPTRDRIKCYGQAESVEETRTHVLAEGYRSMKTSVSSTPWPGT